MQTLINCYLTYACGLLVVPTLNQSRANTLYNA